VSHSSFGPAFLTSIAIHRGVLLVISLVWDWLRLVSPPSGSNETAQVTVVAVLSPAIPVEQEEIAAPAAETEEITTLPPSPLCRANP
jgi:hypothetical protein